MLYSVNMKKVNFSMRTDATTMVRLRKLSGLLRKSMTQIIEWEIKSASERTGVESLIGRKAKREA